MKDRVSKGFPITYPSSFLKSVPCVFTVRFGRKYFIWKGKSLYQSAEMLGKSIRTRLVGNNPDDGFMFHIVNHIKRNQIVKGTIVPSEIFQFTEPVDGFLMLKKEQELLDASREDAMCLNNNVQAYVPQNSTYINGKDKTKFLRWFEKTYPELMEGLNND
jgi:hypothetical protein